MSAVTDDQVLTALLKLLCCRQVGNSAFYTQNSKAEQQAQGVETGSGWGRRGGSQTRVGRTYGGAIFMPPTLGSQLSLAAVLADKDHLMVHVAMDIFILTALQVHLEGCPLRRCR